MVSAEQANHFLEGLTEKQREALQLIVQHKTSKEAGQILGISPYTVDQRITAIKQKVGAASRRELVRIFSDAAGISHRTVYQESCVHESSEPTHEGAVDGRILVSGPPGGESFEIDPLLFRGLPGGSITRVHSNREIEPSKAVDIATGILMTALMLVIVGSGLPLLREAFGFLFD